MRALVVDDEERIVSVVCRILEGGGFEAHGVSSGRACIESFEDINPDILFMDVMMPDMDGWEVLRELRDMGVLDDIKVVMLTVTKAPKPEDADLSPYVTDYITKPFKKDGLLERVAKISAMGG